MWPHRVKAHQPLPVRYVTSRWVGFNSVRPHICIPNVHIAVLRCAPWALPAQLAVGTGKLLMPTCDQALSDHVTVNHSGHDWNAASAI